ncbi:Xpnpep2p [Cyanidiococcus yangmingshanensis]|uniref:Xpnpep2p n=1 Tax=Cyanidiococcus yangmingshanensis TaxID=2690220 RepID=A0A7J7IGG7_9RHOD|nr:Xpnpep2p [Cyanidiococcus yangmingshanensis]
MNVLKMHNGGFMWVYPGHVRAGQATGRWPVTRLTSVRRGAFNLGTRSRHASAGVGHKKSSRKSWKSGYQPLPIAPLHAPRRRHTWLVAADRVLDSLREWLRSQRLDAFIVPTSDPHQSEYPPRHYARREFLTRFTGSAGTALVTTADSEAFLWTDGRYFLQAEQQLPKGWRLMKAGTPGTPTLEEFLAERSRERNRERSGRYRVGIDPFVHSYAWVSRALDMNIHLVPLSGSAETLNPVDQIWGDARPQLPTAAIRIHPAEYAGRSTLEKIAAIRQCMPDDVDGVFVSMLDEVAWLFNIRGADIPHCPVVLAYGLVPRHGEALLFVDPRKLDGKDGVSIQQQLASNGVRVRSYEECELHLRTHFGPGKQRLWMDPASSSLAMVLCAAGVDAEDFAAGQADLPNLRRRFEAVRLQPTPLALMKAVKNEAELAGMRAAHIRDGVALCRFLHWLDVQIEARGNDISKYTDLKEDTIARKLAEFRAQESGFLFTSFDTIAGVGPNGAIIHYRADPSDCRALEPDTVLLLDSGGQYVNGTTDVTRTMFLGGSATSTPSAYLRTCYTSVLRGHIAVDTAVFPENTPGILLDSFARRSLWRHGLDYRHGTGHGVGAALNVHEGPQGITPRMSQTNVGLRAGMIVSNEPGYYEEGQFGIRIENLLVVCPVETERNFGGQRFLGFERLTFVPIATNLLDLDQMTDDEIAWLNKYHREVYDRIAPCLEARHEHDVIAWLERACAPVRRPQGKHHGDGPRSFIDTERSSKGGTSSSASRLGVFFLAAVWTAMSIWSNLPIATASSTLSHSVETDSHARQDAGQQSTRSGSAQPANLTQPQVFALASEWGLPPQQIRVSSSAVQLWNERLADSIPSAGMMPAANETAAEKKASALDSLAALAPRITSRCYLDIEIDGQPAGRIVVGVFGDIAPVSSAHFIDGCVHRYSSTAVYRIVPGLTLQAGDSVPRTERWQLESPRLRFDRAGLVALVHNDRNQGDGRFFITISPEAGYLDGKYVPFGQVTEGIDILQRIAQVGSTRPRNTPKKSVRIVRAGLLDDTSNELVASPSIGSPTATSR